jgi:hypothetical protein
MKPHEDPDKATRALQRAQKEEQFREMIKGIEYFYDWLDCGKSVEELEISLDIAAAGAGWSKSYHEFWRQGLDIIKSARQAGADRNEVVTGLKRIAQERLNAFDEQEF